VSGGSYNYLHAKDTRELFDAVNDLQAARDRIAGLGYANEAAQAVTELLDSIREFDQTTTDRMARIGGVLRALEWWDSNDTDEDGFRRALDALRDEAQPPPPPTYELTIWTEDGDGESNDIGMQVYAEAAPLPRQGEKITFEGPPVLTVVVTEVHHWFDCEPPRQPCSVTVTCEPATEEDRQRILEIIATDQVREWTSQFLASRPRPRPGR